MLCGEVLNFTKLHLLPENSILAQLHPLKLLPQLKMAFVGIILVVRDMGIVLQELPEVPFFFGSKNLLVMKGIINLLIHALKRPS
jgi:hypothetical protein